MATTTRDPNAPGKPRGPTGPAPWTCPLEVIARDQTRLREICDALDRIARARSSDLHQAGQVLRLLDARLVPHLRDETEDLFPLLRRRCPPEDEIGAAIAGIRTEIETARACLPKLRGILAQCLEAGRGPTAPEADCLACFTRHTRHHVIAVKAILLPLARARLTPRDLQSLSLRMQARRGITPEPEDPYAF